MDSENPFSNSFLSYKEMREEENKNLCMEKKSEDDNNCISSCGKHDLFCSPISFFSFSFFFSSPLNSKVPYYKDKYEGWLQLFRLFGPWQNLQINKLEPKGK